jgi:hypothetical protein
LDNWTTTRREEKKGVVCCGVDQASELVEIGRRITSALAKPRTRAVGLNGIRGASDAEIEMLISGSRHCLSRSLSIGSTNIRCQLLKWCAGPVICGAWALISKGSGLSGTSNMAGTNLVGHLQPRHCSQRPAMRTSHVNNPPIKHIKGHLPSHRGFVRRPGLIPPVHPLRPLLPTVEYTSSCSQLPSFLYQVRD